ncbi:MAG TPA: hypothetical protein ACFYD6_01590 [Candidatus Brocadiia bacterium]|nr:hypothetical protein [Candidatus Brocadiales bacterium]
MKKNNVSESGLYRNFKAWDCSPRRIPPEVGLWEVPGASSGKCLRHDFAFGSQYPIRMFHE